MTTPKACDYCDESIPVVCRICGREVNDRYSTHGVGEHIANPVHKIPDPEGIEGTRVVPCGRSSARTSGVESRHG